MRPPILFAAVALLALAYGTAPAAGQLEALEERGPIYISSDTDFTLLNGVRSGSGTASDPYVIEAWTIVADEPVVPVVSPTGDGVVHVTGTTAHFVLRDLVIDGLQGFERGVYLNDLHNGTIEDSVISGFPTGVELKVVEDVAVSRNTITVAPGTPAGLETAIRVDDSARISLSGNTIDGNGSGISTWDATQLRVESNTIGPMDAGEQASAIRVSGGDVVLFQNIVESYGQATAWSGIDIYFPTRAELVSNALRNTTVVSRPAINVEADVAILQENQVTNSNGFWEDGIFVSANDATLRSNRLVDSGALDVRGHTVRFEGNVLTRPIGMGIGAYEVSELTMSGDQVTGLVPSAQPAGSDGSAISVRYTQKATLTGIIVTDNTGNGLFMQDVQELTATGFTSERNTGYGVVVSQAESVQLVDCEVHDNGGGGILDDVKDGQLTVNGCNLEDTEAPNEPTISAVPVAAPSPSVAEPAPNGAATSGPPAQKPTDPVQTRGTPALGIPVLALMASIAAIVARRL